MSSYHYDDDDTVISLNLTNFKVIHSRLCNIALSVMIKFKQLNTALIMHALFFHVEIK